jgi:hypothetical protein
MPNALSVYDYVMKGISNIFEGKATRLLVGVNRHEVCNVEGGDYTPTITNCRVISCDQSGIIKFDYVDEFDGKTSTRVMQVTQGTFYSVRNVTKVYHDYRAADGGTTYDCTAQAYTDTG